MNTLYNTSYKDLKIVKNNEIWDTLFVNKGVINCGRFGVVHAAIRRNDRLNVAIKQLPKVRHDIEPVRTSQLIESEIASLSKITETKRTKNVIKLYDVVQDNENVYLVMENCHRGNLTKFTSIGIQNERHISFFARHILHGLVECHENNILHGDIKPSNILLAKYHLPKLGDFGHSTECDKHTTGCFKRHGTPFYSAPDVFDADYGHCADMWAFGVVIFQMAFPGYHPLMGNEEHVSGYEIYRAITTRSIRWPHNHTTFDFRDFIERCIKKKKDDRWTAKEALEHSFIKKFLCKQTEGA